MGHDVEIGYHQLYITGNFSRLDNFWGGIHYFHGHKASVMVEIIKIMILKAKRERIAILPFEPTIENWRYGTYPNGTRKPEREVIGIFLEIMFDFLKCGEEYPDSIVRSDNVGYVTKNPLSRFLLYKTDLPVAIVDHILTFV